MTEITSDTLLVLEAGLFPDAATLDDALLLASEKSAIRRQKITSGKMDDAAWDQLLDDILTAKSTLTL